MIYSTSLHDLFLMISVFLTCFDVSLFPGTDQSEAQLLGPNRQILGPTGMSFEDSSRGEEDFRSIPTK